LRLLEHVDRRTFLKAAGVLGAGAVLGGGMLRTALRVLGDEPVHSRMRTGMGTFVEIDVAGAPSDLADEAIARAFDEMDRLVAILSRHDASSPLSQLNERGRLDAPQPEVVDVVLAALDVHRRSGGRFDPTVLPLVELLESTRDGSAPSPHEVTERLALVDAAAIRFDDRGVSLDREGMHLTLDGIAKGYIVDRMSDVLAGAGATSHLVNAGGDIRTRGERASGHPWRIAVQDPEKRGDYPAVIRMRDGAVATSGSYERFYNADHTRHHIIDPQTGASPGRLVSATVRAASVLEADALSTAVFVMGPQRGAQLVAATAGAEVLTIDAAGKRTATPAFVRGRA
jgi:thiamine biosynthesis lipoprotein